jgi:hypothetical protein
MVVDRFLAVGGKENGMRSDEVRRSAQRVQLIGTDVRRLSDQALAMTATPWRSTAAAHFRRRLCEEADRVRAVAVGLDDAADSLFRHALAVDNACRTVHFGAIR